MLQVEARKDRKRWEKMQKGEKRLEKVEKG
jgi:hypothetical protein